MDASASPLTRRYRLPKPLDFIQMPLIPQENFQILATGVGLAMMEQLKGVTIPKASREVLMGVYRSDTVDDYALGLGEGLATVVTDLIDMAKLGLWLITHVKEALAMATRALDLMLGADPQTEALLREIGYSIGQGMGNEIKRTLHDHQLLARTIGRVSGEVSIAIILALLSGGISAAAKASKVGKLRWLAGVAEKFSKRLKGMIRVRHSPDLPDVHARSTAHRLGTAEEPSVARALENKTLDDKSISSGQRNTQPAVPVTSAARADIPEKAPSIPKPRPSEQPAELLPGTKTYTSQEVFLDSTQRRLFMDFLTIVNRVYVERAAKKARSRIRFTPRDRRLKDIAAEVYKIKNEYPGGKRVPDEKVRKRVAEILREAHEIGRARWGDMRGKVWNELYKDNDFLRLVQNTGVILPENLAKAENAAMVRVADPRTGKIFRKALNIDHKTPITLNPFRSLDPDNFRLMTPSENSVFMEMLRKQQFPVSNDEFEKWLLQYGLSPEERLALLRKEYPK
jgi:hypothetical protein